MFTVNTAISCVLLGLLRVVLRVQAEPLPPTIISPRSGDVWTVGQVATVEWSTQGIQLYADNRVTPLPGILWLGHLVNYTVAGYELWGLEPLANNFPLPLAKIQVVVPDVPSGSNYLLSLNDNANLGELFTIHNPADPSGTGVAPSSISVSTLSFPTTGLPGEFVTSTTTSPTSSATSTSGSSSSSSSAPTSKITNGAARVVVSGSVGLCTALMTVTFLFI
ncbi:hypothetical protein FKP32DRAFT_1676325 [Trametes sanguinea]|nr:hypothetical protein FKP32DRAFT_1676325 [Trametes sanguinea]